MVHKLKLTNYERANVNCAKSRARTNCCFKIPVEERRVVTVFHEIDKLADVHTNVLFSFGLCCNGCAVKQGFSLCIRLYNVFST